MVMALDHIKLSEKAKDQLVKLKRVTGIPHWNILCRWAFCTSLAEPTIPSPTKIPADSSVEMTWKIFGGSYEEVYLALLRQRCEADGLGASDEVLSVQFRLHLHRGIGHLAAEKSLKSIADLCRHAEPV